MREEERAHLGAGEANGAARHGDRVAARGEALGRARRRLPRYDAQALRRHVELLGGDLRERSEHALTDLDLAGRKPHAALLLEADPRRQQRIVGKALRQRGHGRAPVAARADEPGSGRVSGARTIELPRWPLASLASAARATARMTRLCTPQRQRWRSSAVAISLRLGRGLRASSAVAEINM